MADYYIDPVDGLDTNPGTSPSQAWKTNAPVNTAHVFYGGDKIHIAGGSTLACNTGTPNGACLYILGANNLNGFPVNFIPMGGLPLTIDNNFNTQNGPYTIDLSGGSLQWGIAVVNADVLITGGIIKGGAPAQLGTFENSAGVYLQPQNNGSVNATVTGMEIYDFSVLIWAAQAVAGAATGKFTNNHLHGSTPTTTVDFGILMQGWTNSLIEGNLIENIGGRPNEQPPQGSGSGILISNGSSQVIDRYNIVRNGGVNNNLCGNAYGNWAYNSTYITIEHNEVYGQKRAGGCDGGGYDFDGGVQNSVMRLNYSHGNAGPGFALWMGSVNGNAWGPNTVENNVSVGDGLGDPTNAGDGTIGGIYLTATDGNTKPVYILNNVVWNTAPSAGKRAGAIAAFNSGNANGTISGNLFISAPDQYGNAELVYLTNQSMPGLVWAGNAYRALGGTPQWYQVGTGPNNSVTSLAAWQAIAPGGDVGACMADANIMGGFSIRGVYGLRF